MRYQDVILLITKILVGLTFVAFLIAFMVKDYSLGYNGLAKNPVTVEAVAGLGLFLLLSAILTEALDIVVETRLLLFLKLVGFLLLFSAATAVVGYGVASEFIAMGITIVWLLPTAYMVYLLTRPTGLLPLSSQRAESSVLSEEMPEFRKSAEKEVYSLETHRGRCKCCVLWAYFLLLAVAAVAIAANSVVEAYSLRKYEVVGRLVEVPVYPLSQPAGPAIKLRINCIGNTSGKATFLFEHGGGANGLAFQAVQDFLEESGRRSCTYDRPGYGRSDPGPNDATPEENAMRTMTLLKNAGEAGPYVAVGWSAGVELVQVLRYYYPANITGLGYVDGYPNYRVLEAIDRNLTEDYVAASAKSLVGLLGFIKNLEPFGIGAVVGSFPTYHPE